MAQNAVVRNPREVPHGVREVLRSLALWLLFLLICLGLGYSALNRYDPTQTSGTRDGAVYRDMVVRGGSGQALEGPDALARLGKAENYYRLLVPAIARPIYLLAVGRTGTWDPAMLGLLMANSLFTATTVSLLMEVGRHLGLNRPTTLLAAALYLLNFAVVNLNLAGLIDSGEACFMLAVVWSQLEGRWYLLPVWGVMGALAKETFAPLCTIFVLGWWIAGEPGNRLRFARIPWICALAASSLLTVSVAMSIVARGWVWPWEFAASMHSGGGLLAGLRDCLLNHTFWYVFVWLLPLGIPRLHRLPLPWVVASGMAFCGALVLGAYNNAGGNTARALFNVAGPILSLSAAMFLSESKLESHRGAAAEKALPS